jgi:hypothetical protein
VSGRRTRHDSDVGAIAAADRSRAAIQASSRELAERLLTSHRMQASLVLLLFPLAARDGDRSVVDRILRHVPGASDVAARTIADALGAMRDRRREPDGPPRPGDLALLVRIERIGDATQIDLALSDAHDRASSVELPQPEEPLAAFGPAAVRVRLLLPAA